MRTLFLALTLGSIATLSAWASPLRVLLIDGQNNHDWKSSSPWIKKVLEESGLFSVDVATTPPAGADDEEQAVARTTSRTRSPTKSVFLTVCRCLLIAWHGFV